MCLRLMEGMNISFLVSESCLHVDEEVLQMDGAAGDLFFLRFVVMNSEGYMKGAVNNVEVGSIVPVFAGIGTIAGFCYLDLAYEEYPL